MLGIGFFAGWRTWAVKRGPLERRRAGLSLGCALRRQTRAGSSSPPQFFSRAAGRPGPAQSAAAPRSREFRSKSARSMIQLF